VCARDWVGYVGYCTGRGLWFRNINVRSLYRSWSVTAVARDGERYGLDLVGVQGIRWDM
jgi:hypothetical protein